MGNLCAVFLICQMANDVAEELAAGQALSDFQWNVWGDGMQTRAAVPHAALNDQEHNIQFLVQS